MQSNKKPEISVTDYIEINMGRSMNKAGDFGIDGYNIQRTDALRERPTTTVFSKNNFPHYIEKYARDRKWIPEAKYDNIVQDWTKNFPKRGAFLKGPRKTYSEETMIMSKKRGVPAPGQYNHKEYVGSCKKKEKDGAQGDRVLGCIEDAMYMGQ